MKLNCPNQKLVKYMELDATDIRLLAELQENSAINNQDLAARAHISPPTCLRRVRRLKEEGFIERQIAILGVDKLAATFGHGLEAVVEITLDNQGAERFDAFESRVGQDDAVQQCYRVSPGPDFIIHLRARDMPGYLTIAQRLFTADANVRNVKAFFVVKRSKFRPNVPLAQ
jgi:Lrp/AsnC family transcriptional regulator, leucine-responsive regulatory protein